MTKQFNLDTPMGPPASGIMAKAKELSDLLGQGYEEDGKFLIKKNQDGRIEEDLYVRSALYKGLYVPSNFFAYTLYRNKKIRERKN